MVILSLLFFCVGSFLTWYLTCDEPSIIIFRNQQRKTKGKPWGCISQLAMTLWSCSTTLRNLCLILSQCKTKCLDLLYCRILTRNKNFFTFYFSLGTQQIFITKWKLSWKLNVLTKKHLDHNIHTLTEIQIYIGSLSGFWNFSLPIFSPLLRYREELRYTDFSGTSFILLAMLQAVKSEAQEHSPAILFCL